MTIKPNPEFNESDAAFHLLAAAVGVRSNAPRITREIVVCDGCSASRPRLHYKRGNRQEIPKAGWWTSRDGERVDYCPKCAKVHRD